MDNKDLFEEGAMDIAGKETPESVEPTKEDSDTADQKTSENLLDVYDDSLKDKEDKKEEDTPSDETVTDESVTEKEPDESPVNFEEEKVGWSTDSDWEEDESSEGGRTTGGGEGDSGGGRKLPQWAFYAIAGGFGLLLVVSIGLKFFSGGEKSVSASTAKPAIAGAVVAPSSPKVKKIAKPKKLLEQGKMPVVAEKDIVFSFEETPDFGTGFEPGFGSDFGKPLNFPTDLKTKTKSKPLAKKIPMEMAIAPVKKGAAKVPMIVKEIVVKKTVSSERYDALDNRVSMISKQLEGLSNSFRMLMETQNEDTVVDTSSEIRALRAELDVLRQQVRQQKQTTTPLVKPVKKPKMMQEEPKVSVLKAAPKKEKKMVRKLKPVPMKKVKWILKSAVPNVAWVSEEGSTYIRRVVPGNTLPTIGRVISIKRSPNGSWVIKGSTGMITQ